MTAVSPQPKDNRTRRAVLALVSQSSRSAWLKPHLVAQIEYADWTDVNHLRHSKFIVLRDDKPAKDVRREQPVG